MLIVGNHHLFANNKNVKEDNDMDNIRIPIHIG